MLFNCLIFLGGGQDQACDYLPMKSLKACSHKRTMVTTSGPPKLITEYSDLSLFISRLRGWERRRLTPTGRLRMKPRRRSRSATWARATAASCRGSIFNDFVLQPRMSLWQHRNVIMILIICFRLNRREARGWLKEKRKRRLWPTGSNPWKLNT